MTWPANVLWKPGAKLVARLLPCAALLAAGSGRADSSVPLAWNPGADISVAGYRIYYGTASHNYTSVVDAGGSTNITINSLADGTTYYFAATTYDLSGTESGFSDEASFFTPPSVFLPPALAAIGNVSTSENAGLQTVNFSGIATGTGPSVAITAVSSNPALIPNPTVNYASPNTGGSLVFAPQKFAFGTATITVTADNGMPHSNLVTRTFTVNVAPVYQPPTLAAIGNVSLNENAGPQTLGLSGISQGTGPSVAITAASSNPALIPNPTVNYTSPNAGGSLAFAPLKNTFGTATITVTANNGMAKSNLVTRTFTVTVAQVFQAPTLPAVGNVVLSENAGAQNIGLYGISQGTGPSVTIAATSSNPALVPNPSVNYASPNFSGSLAFAPAKNSYGTATITVTANNGLAKSNLTTRTFVVNVLPVNQPPTLDALPDLVLGYNPPVQSVKLSGISSGAANEKQRLKITAVSANPQLVPNPVVTYASPNSAGTLTLRPTANASGSAVITVTVNDGGASNNIVSQSFKVTLAAAASSLVKPVVLSQPADSVALGGKPVTLKVGAAGRGLLKYQWKFNGADVPGATGPVLTLKNVSAAHAGLYSVTVSNDYGWTNSLPANLEVFDTPAAKLAPSPKGRGHFGFKIKGVTGYQYLVQASTDFVHWTTIQTNTAPFDVDDAQAGQYGQRFYRTVYVP